MEVIIYDNKRDTTTLLKGERITLECKEAKNAVPKSIWESYSAFANTVGGTILLGIKENTNEKDPAKRFTITGVEDRKKQKVFFYDT